MPALILTFTNEVCPLQQLHRKDVTPAIQDQQNARPHNVQVMTGANNYTCSTILNAVAMVCVQGALEASEVLCLSVIALITFPVYVA